MLIPTEQMAMGDVDVKVGTADSKPRAAAPLAYKLEPPGGRVSVRGFRLLLVLTLLNTTLLAASVLGPQLFPFIQASWGKWQASRAQEQARQAARAIEQQSLAHVIPADRVVYEEDPDRAAALVSADPSGYRSVRAGSSEPPGWHAPVRAVSPGYANGNEYPLLFLHERVTPAGTHYVVTVYLLTQNTFSRGPAGPSGKQASMYLKKTRQLYAEARLATSRGAPPPGVEGAHRKAVPLILPDAGARELVRFSGDPSIDQSPRLDYGNILRFFGGQADPDDAAHFTLHYQVDGRDGVIDGWMKDDGVEMRPREGHWTLEPNGLGWHLPAGPDTRPTTLPTTSPATAPSAAPQRP
jgi:hypothetical protein